MIISILTVHMHSEGMCFLATQDMNVLQTGAILSFRQAIYLLAKHLSIYFISTAQSTLIARKSLPST
jgi:hypothetical protein